MKKCNHCKKEKEDIEFPQRKYKSGKIGLDYRCYECKRKSNRERLRKKRASAKYRNKERERAYQNRLKNPEKAMHRRSKKRAKSKGIAFDIKVKDIHIPDRCPLLNIPIEVQKGGANDFSPSLDRIDSTRGYVQGNIWVISRLANIMKAHATIDQLLLFSKNIQKYLLSPDKTDLKLESPETDNQLPSS